ncbi:MAG: hypothetical protein Q9M43_00160 [Sulfurimonas sp.]|nr:hypothetical protein [Sulfurimonas sp.]
MKKTIYFVLIILLFLLIFSKPLSIFFLEKSLTRSLKQEVEITSLEFYPLNLDAIIKMQHFPEGIFVHARYAGGLSLSPRSIGKFIITSSSLGGLVTIDYEHYIYHIKVDSLDFKKVAKVLADKKYVQSGLVNGTIIYYKKKREGSTKLKVTEVVLTIPDIDQSIQGINDLLKLNAVNLFSHNISLNSDTNETTLVDHFQFDIDYKKDKITTKDVALRTDSYRISISSKLDKRGNIDYFFINLLDKNGCALVKQKLSGNVREKPERMTYPLVGNVVQTSPKSFFGMGQQMMQYGSDYAGKQTGMKSQTNQISSFMLKESDAMFENTSSMLLKDCKVIYTGKVKYPLGQKKQMQETELENSPMLYRKELLL